MNNRTRITNLNGTKCCSSSRPHFHSEGDGLTQSVGTPPILPATGEYLSRRCFLRTSAATAGGLVGLGTTFASAPPVLQTNLSPQDALSELMDGNRRYVTGKTTAHEHDLQVLKAKTAEKQQPFAAVLSCADSRVPVELVFDQTIGHIFVCRIAGNVTTPEIIASLEYGAAVLGTESSWCWDIRTVVPSPPPSKVRRSPDKSARFIRAFDLRST